jgi:hypothetical protein
MNADVTDTTVQMQGRTQHKLAKEKRDMQQKFALIGAIWADVDIFPSLQLILYFSQNGFAALVLAIMQRLQSKFGNYFKA